MAEGQGPKIAHFFVLMLENRSYDHVLGYESILGRAPGGPSGPTLQAEGLTGNESNPEPGPPAGRVTVSPTAPDSIGFDPHHEFPDIRTQLCGPNGDYPNVTMQGFVASNGPRVMQAFAPGRLPALTALAREYAVCDHWYSALPGPTWPNRFFAMAATSGGLFCSPGDWDTFRQITYGSYDFQNGDIFKSMERVPAQRRGGCAPWRVYHQGLPLSLTLKGMGLPYFLGESFRDFPSRFAADLGKGDAAALTFIEPHYGGLADDLYTEGDSQHPNGNMQDGENLIRKVYQAIRASQLWERSLLLITYDEHGGFYDHVVPPEAVPPGDEPRYASQNGKGLAFDFRRQGVRVPAVVVSPWIARGTVVKERFDHAAISRTLDEVWATGHLTQRDAPGVAHGLAPLLCLDRPRLGPDEAPPVLPPPPPPLGAAGGPGPDEEVRR